MAYFVARVSLHSQDLQEYCKSMHAIHTYVLYIPTLQVACSLVDSTHTFTSASAEKTTWLITYEQHKVYVKQSVWYK